MIVQFKIISKLKGFSLGMQIVNLARAGSGSVVVPGSMVLRTWLLMTLLR